MKEIINKQKKYFLTGQTMNIDFRRNSLLKLLNALKEFEEEIISALNEDLGKSPFESYETEIAALYMEINYFLNNIKKWAKPKRVSSPFFNFPSSGRIYKEPLGVVLIISPWNYPIQLSIAPLIAAIGAGNCAVIKPSEHSPNTSRIIKNMLEYTFPHEYVSVVEGGSDICKQLLCERFDHIFFTGSPAIGKKIMESAAKNLTPVTLELGGKSPCIVDETADIDTSAKRIVWGKFLNSGQTCVAPDYLLAGRNISGQLIDALKKYISEFYGQDPLSCPDYSKIINERHFNRICSLLKNGQILYGGRYDRKKLKIVPTLIGDVSLNDPIMQEEIFGPVLPILEYDNIEDAINIIRKFEKPLALYLFTENKATEKRILNSVSFGGGCINDTIIHLTGSAMPFGGVGQSGIGAYHGKYGFDTFSHEKTVVKKSNLIDIPLRYPPYKDKISLLRKLLK